MYLSKKDISEWIASLKAGDEVAVQITRMDGVIVSSERGIVDKWLGKRLIVVNGKRFVPSTGLRQSNAFVPGQKTIVEQLFPLDALLLDEEELLQKKLRSCVDYMKESLGVTMEWSLFFPERDDFKH